MPERHENFMNQQDSLTNAPQNCLTNTRVVLHTMNLTPFKRNSPIHT